MAREDTDLPFGDAFSPAQLETGKGEPAELVVLLEMAKKYEGQPDDFDQAIADRFFSDSNEPSVRAKNVRLGMREGAGYGIVHEDLSFTEIGEELYELRDDEESMFEQFAVHILQELHGMKVIQIIEDLMAEGRQTTNANIKEALRNQYGFHVDRTSNHWSQMRAWLAKTGVVNTGIHIYDLDRNRLEELVGVDSDAILELDGLTEEQQTFLRGLALIDPVKPIPNTEVRKVAEAAYGVELPQSKISDLILNPLEDSGYITWKNPSDVTGKPNLVEPTDQFEAEVMKPVLEDISERTGVPRPVLRLSFDEISERLDSDSTHEKGVALETLAVKIGRMLGLEFAGWRVRGQKTGGSEVDVVMDEVDTTFGRWQIQCKNIKDDLETKHVAREVGIARMLQTNTILMVARSGLSGDAKLYANRIMRHENISILFLHGDDLDQFDERPEHLAETLQDEANRIKTLKRLDRRDMVEEGDGEGKMTYDEEEALEEYQEDIAEYITDEEDVQNSLTDFAPDEDS
ncbi:restriction endonuclease [Halopiger xanaduensis]|uniref:Restriction endonuclease type IV Mrr domain-containing protein n=1 Tax=Halopiger xanaduensis (strain DSM 18323 / JCM 14033 / SH-6) TaxID=797210 RepID=F8D4R2_HALXS|nr:restriction endonuclease [Halopiger xanaduensis]AEH37531.1 hypothetical protein Halxa_2915 [Halopiger xanaduensis SH-6]